MRECLGIFRITKEYSTIYIDRNDGIFQHIYLGICQNILENYVSEISGDIRYN